ncbi:hypothetical protein VNO77_00959 [Canavalia gladiata]|uniref:Uncharacterized protein n=1 Tax=Canavalia gladiata TaxID=3824 RepID=A0AAN9R1T4_CANGL
MPLSFHLKTNNAVWKVNTDHNLEAIAITFPERQLRRCNLKAWEMRERQQFYALLAKFVGPKLTVCLIEEVETHGGQRFWSTKHFASQPEHIYLFPHPTFSPLCKLQSFSFALQTPKLTVELL